MKKKIAKMAVFVCTVCMLGYGGVQSVKAESAGYYSKTNAPEFYGTTKAVIETGDEFDTQDTRYRIFARDFEDGDLTDNIKILNNTVDSSKAGEYSVEYQVTDSDGNKSECTMDVIVQDNCKSRYYERTLYSLPSVANMTLAGTYRGNGHDRQMLGFYMEQGASINVKLISGADRLNLNYWNNDSQTELSFNITGDDTTVTSDVAGGVPFIQTVYDAKEPVVVGITINADDSQGKVSRLPYYHYQDNEKEFFDEWEADTDSYAVIESEDITVLVPYADRNFLVNYYGKCHKSLDEFLQYWHKIINQYDEFLGLSYDAEDAIDQNVKTKYFVKANAHGAGSAYYSVSHVGINNKSVASFFEMNWGGLHEVGHGYQGSLAHSGMELGEVSNNIVGHYVQIDKNIYTYNDDWLGSLSGIEQKINAKRLNGTTFSELAVNEQLYFLVNFLDTYNAKDTYARINQIWRRALRDKRNITAQDAYVLAVNELYNANTAPYFESWGLSISDSVKKEIAGSTILYPLADMVNDTKKAQTIRQELSKEGMYSLVSGNELSKYNMSGSVKISLAIDDVDELIGKKITIQNGENYKKEITITGSDVLLKDISAGAYEIKLPVPKKNIYEYEQLVFVVVKNGKIDEKNIKYENKTATAPIVDTVIRFNGLGDGNFATITFKDANTMRIVSKSASPHYYFTDEYACIKVYNAQNELIYSRSYVGNENKGAADDEVTVEMGYKIEIMHREAKVRLVPYSNILEDKDSSLVPTETTTIYMVGEYGLYKEANEDESYIYYKEKLDKYISKVCDGMSEEELKDENVKTDLKRNILLMILKLKDTDKNEYYEKYKDICNGSNQDISKIEVTRPAKVISLKQENLYYTSMIILKWKKVQGSNGYEIYRATTKNGKYKKIKTTTSAVYKDKKLKSGKQYYYKVRAYKIVDNKKIYGECSKIEVMVTKPKTSVIKLKSGNKNITITWKKVTGASGYEIRRATAKNGKYKKIKTTLSAVYKDKNLKSGKIYYYKVRAYKIVNNKKIYGGYSKTAVMATKPKTPSIKLKSGKKKVTVTWKKVTGASGYEIRMATKKNGKFNIIKKTSSKTLSYTKKNLANNKKYYYKVRAYKKVNGRKVYSSWSKVKARNKVSA